MDNLANDTPSNWFVAQTLAHKEKLALGQLQNQGFDVFLPTINRRIRRGRKYVDVQRPLFPGYIFISSEMHPASQRNVNGTLGVHRLLYAAGKPARLPEGFIASLKRRLSGELEASNHPFEVGDQVRLEGGPFHELCGEILAVRADARVVLLLDLLSRRVSVSVPLGDVVAA